MKIQVGSCVYNKLSTKQDIKNEYEFEQQDGQYQHVELSEYFGSSISSCSPTYEFTQDGVKYETIRVYISSGKLSISLKEEYEIKLKLTVSAAPNLKIEKDITFKVIKAASNSFVAAISNQPPKFQGVIPKTLEFDYIVDKSGEPQDIETIEVTSPKAIDPEGGKIFMLFDNGGKAFISFKQNPDNTVTIKANKGLIFKKEDQKIPISITLIDDKKSKTVYNADVIINYKVAGAAEEDKGDDDEDSDDEDDNDDQDDETDQDLPGPLTRKQRRKRRGKKMKKKNQLGKLKKQKTDEREKKKEQTKTAFDDSLDSLGLSKKEAQLLKLAFEKQKEGKRKGKISKLPNLSED